MPRMLPISSVRVNREVSIV